SRSVNEAQVVLAQHLANDEVILTVKTSNAEVMQISVTDHVGNIMYATSNEDVGPGTHTFVNDISSLRKGLYFYKIQLGSKTHTRKVIKY
ncbi:MAG: T9SS type A sorting domain-containing protein, partial [Cytophagales bacterium]|nr:T9SS type A sorting domain-containing protein [Cytophagales bacterium]